jgi:hypothetical protein
MKQLSFKMTENAYSDTSQLDLSGGRDLRSSEVNKFTLERSKLLVKICLGLLSESVSSNLLCVC